MTDVYTVRMAIFDTEVLSATDIVELYKTALKTAGFRTDQLPSMSYPDYPVKITINDPFPGARTLTIQSADFGELSQTRDTNVPYEQDPARLADSGRANASLFTWNLCVPSGSDPAGTLRNIFRSTQLRGALKTSPKVTKWENTPVTLQAFANRPERPYCDSATATSAGKKSKVGLWTALIGGALWLLSKGKIG